MSNAGSAQRKENRLKHSIINFQKYLPKQPGELKSKTTICNTPELTSSNTSQSNQVNWSQTLARSVQRESSEMVLLSQPPELPPKAARWTKLNLYHSRTDLQQYLTKQPGQLKSNSRIVQ